MFTVIHGKVPETAEHERIISLVLVCVDDAPATDLFDGQAKKGLCFAVWNDLDKYLAAPGENAENRDLACGAAAALAFALAAETGFIQFNFAGKEDICILRVSQDSHPEYRHSPVGRVVGNADLLCDHSCRYFEFKELDDPEPLAWAQPAEVDPALWKIMLNVATLFTSASAVDDFDERS